MFENVKKAIFGRTKPEESEAPRGDASPVEQMSGADAQTEAVVGNGIEKVVRVAGDGSDVEESSEKTNPDFERADVEGSEQDDVAVEAAEESVAATEQPAELAGGGSGSSASDLDKAKAEAAENYDKYIRAVAELENYKKRALRERADVLRYAGESLARDMLEIADHLQRALAQDMDGVREDFVKGLQLILDRFQAIMEQHQVRGEPSVGTAFDPVKHEALASVPTADHPAGTVLEEFKRAYYFKDKLLRPAQVVVAKEDEPSAE